MNNFIALLEECIMEASEKIRNKIDWYTSILDLLELLEKIKVKKNDNN